MTNIMKHVDLLDLVRVEVNRIPGTGQFRVFIEAIDKEKKVVMDPSAQKTLNNKITSICKEKNLSALDPNTIGYIKEFVGRVVSELARNGLVELADYEDRPDDPYAEIRKEFSKI